ncbi:hypothetical protein PS9374_04662 [Planomonospora sphaerica]|uniref:Uncharacterized protein n=1 Tax=Planomonospora sphaerica TaxID=161355 RepID=A0A171DJI8_9ACTN|nr:hypothetical protein [Planomonospora sphaerica]GAT68997.1 hypothetical protein PS9374_04662 [Planomonospora sphaerica]
MSPEPSDRAPDPRREELLRALAKVRAHAARLEAALDPAHAAFTGKAVWTGPTARAFIEELTGHRARLRTLTRRIVEELEGELRAIPENTARSSAAR